MADETTPRDSGEPRLDAFAAPKRLRGAGFWRGWVFPLLVTLFITISFRSAVADWNDIPSGSMRPTLIEGDRVGVNKLAYDLRVPLTSIRVATWANPKRGDIVIFFSPADGRRLVKRVVGVPGDVIQLTNNHLVVNGRPASYEPVPADRIPWASSDERAYGAFLREEAGDPAHLVLLNPRSPECPEFGPVTVPAGSYFMMGDNRDNSGDSRFFGFVARRRIVGRVNRVVFSVDHDHHGLPREDRLFRRPDAQLPY